jgi:putative cell wall-binding protein
VDYLPTWWTSASGSPDDYADYPGEATPVVLPTSSATVANMVLPVAANISGVVTTSTGGIPATPTTIQFHAYRSTANYGLYPYYHADEVDGYLTSSGSYSLAGVMPGAYQISFVGEIGDDAGGDYAPSTAGSTDSDPGANTTENVGQGQTLTGANGVIFRQGFITGTVTCAACSSSLTMIKQGQIFRQAAGGSWSYAGFLDTPNPSTGLGNALDEYGLVPGTYELQAEVANQPQMGWAMSSPIVVTEGNTSTTELAIGPPSMTRLAGADRYATSVAISDNNLDPAKDFTAGVPVVYIANGLNYPDALSAGPAAAAQHGPLLLVTPTSIPAPVMQELTRLQPKSIVVAGGTAAVSNAVFSQLQTYVSKPADVVRIAGADRYGTSIAIAEHAFPHGATTAYLATGTNFPDALSAGGAAAESGGPVIIVNGAETSVDSATQSALAQLGVRDVTVAGGEASMSAELYSSLSSTAGLTVSRVAGDDRYETSSYLNQLAFPTSTMMGQLSTPPKFAFLALGTNFPDALSGGALAGTLGAPLFVVPSDCIPQSIEQDLQSMQITKVVLLGGTASLGQAVSSFAECPA